MRKIVNTVCHKMWGKQMFIAIEKAIMSKLNLEYTDILVDNSKCKTRRKHGSIMSMLQRMKQTYIIDGIRLIGKDDKLEVIYERELKRPTEGIAKVIRVSTLTHGYDGYMGLAHGHPDLIKMQKVASNQLKVPMPDKLLVFLKGKLISGTEQTTAELLEEWQKSDKGMVVSVHDGDSTSSPLTQSSVSVSVFGLFVAAFAVNLTFSIACSTE